MGCMQPRYQLHTRSPSGCPKDSCPHWTQELQRPRPWERTLTVGSNKHVQLQCPKNSNQETPSLAPARREAITQRSSTSDPSLLWTSQTSLFDGGANTQVEGSLHVSSLTFAVASLLTGFCFLQEGLALLGFGRITACNFAATSSVMQKGMRTCNNILFEQGSCCCGFS